MPGLGRFLLGRFFYSDAVNTVIVVMSVVTTETLGVSDAAANGILLGLTVVAIAMSFVWGWLVDRLGPKRTLMIVLVSWAVGLVIGGIAIGFGPSGLPPFLVAGAILGSGLGGVTVADRVLMIRLSPPERIGEFFGLYGLVGKGSQVIGTLLYGLTLFLFLDTLGDTRLPDRGAQPARDDGHRRVAGVAGPRRLVGQPRGREGRIAAAARTPRPGIRSDRAP